MIPDITAILEMYKAGECTMTQALAWIEQHQENADLRDHFAGQSILPAMSENATCSAAASVCYEMADAMLKARKP